MSMDAPLPLGAEAQAHVDVGEQVVLRAGRVVVDLDVRPLAAVPNVPRRMVFGAEAVDVLDRLLVFLDEVVVAALDVDRVVPGTMVLSDAVGLARPTRVDAMLPPPKRPFG
ncbi:hypothetical protein NG895_12665 [Aeoliella sp. ICT_H6.2]|uniref:Uncharacterized protein n=1 Tax=Aeoliella straminimaris TaxID=2954799 RepID=A0A9X2F9A8_9BACT|nr:hypothetical protein [Aeoliella straminimaris]MCO6044762.1 hypothetical protein [Aeoliella straminimaris]